MGSEEIQTGKSERKDEIAREDKYEILFTELDPRHMFGLHAKEGDP